MPLSPSKSTFRRSLETYHGSVIGYAEAAKRKIQFGHESCAMDPAPVLGPHAKSEISPRPCQVLSGYGVSLTPGVFRFEKQQGTPALRYAAAPLQQGLVATARRNYSPEGSLH